MTKEFTLKQLTRYRCAVDLDQGTLAPLTVLVNGACDQFLPCSGFSQQQHARIRRSDHPDLHQDLFQRVALADHLAVPEM